MAWVDISESTYKERFYCPYQGGESASYMPYVTLQYDDSSLSPTSATFRFKFIKTGTSGPTDMFYALLYPTDSTKRTLLTLKGWHGADQSKWPLYSGSFKISKTYTTGTFTIPAYWICNDGNNNTADTATDFYNQYKDGAWRGDNLRRTVSAQSIAVVTDTTVATAIGTGSCSVTDHYNNSYTASGTRGAAGTNNAVNGAKLLYGLGTSSGSYSTKDFTSDSTTASSGAISFTPTTAATRTVYAAVTTDGVHNDTDTGWKSFSVKQYLAPNNPTSVTLDSSSLKNNRLTIKQGWKYTWSGASQINDSCPIKGYRYCLEKKNGTSWTKVALKDSSGNAISGKLSSSNEYDTTSTNATFDPAKTGLVAGDVVRFSVKAFTKYGNANDGTILPNGSYATSSESTIQNAGVMRVKPTSSSGWKEGVVWVKVKKNNVVQWVEADIVQVKTSSGWKESN